MKKILLLVIFVVGCQSQPEIKGYEGCGKYTVALGEGYLEDGDTNPLTPPQVIPKGILKEGNCYCLKGKVMGTKNAFKLHELASFEDKGTCSSFLSLKPKSP